MTGRPVPLIVGNWKMHKTSGEAAAFVAAWLARGPVPDGVEAVLCPPFTALGAVREALAGTPAGLGAQTMSWAEQGAFTGQISAPMLRDCGCTWVIVGHSERRAHCGETDETVNRTISTALANGITPIVAVGETAEEHEAGRATERVVGQVRAAFAGRSAAEAARCTVAYEPIWAIGSGKSDDPVGANAVMGEIRGAVPGLDRTRLLYGGSVKPETIAALVAQPNIDGALVGGASLDPASFATLLALAARARAPAGAR